MAGTLTFPVTDDLKAIVDHARTAPTRRPNYVELFDPAIRKDGKEPAEGEWPEQDDVDPERIPHGLWLVYDRGVYLMSPGDPMLPSHDGKGSLVAYAVECDPKNEDWWDAKRSIVGGDDGVDKLDLGFFEAAIARGAKEIRVVVTETQLKLEA